MWESTGWLFLAAPSANDQRIKRDLQLKPCSRAVFLWYFAMVEKIISAVCSVSGASEHDNRHSSIKKWTSSISLLMLVLPSVQSGDLTRLFSVDLSKLVDGTGGAMQPIWRYTWTPVLELTSKTKVSSLHQK
jgi:hypothetical protein